MRQTMLLETPNFRIVAREQTDGWSEYRLQKKSQATGEYYTVAFEDTDVYAAIREIGVALHGNQKAEAGAKVP